MLYSPVRTWNRKNIKINDRGYVLVYVPQHPKSFRGGWYYEHRLVAERELGRILRKWETVHHINEDKSFNVWLNLFVCTRKEHDYAAA